MPLNFPINPSVNDTYSFGGKTWIWNGQGWQLSAAGAINDIPIGNITPSTGAFTELTADSGNFSGNVTAAYFIGDGSQLTGISASGNSITSGDSNVDISSAGADITMSVSGVSNVVVISPDGVTVTGNITSNNAVFVGNVVLSNLSIGAGGSIDAGNSTISNVAEPVANSDVATKAYVDSQSASDFTIEDDLANTTVVSGGDTLMVLGTADQITVLITDTDEITFGLSDNVVIQDNLSVTSTANVGILESQGNITGANLSVTGDVAGNTGTFTGNVSGDTFLGNVDGATGAFIGNVTGDTFLGNIEGDYATFTGNVSGDTFLGNIEGDYATFTGNVDTANVNATGTIDASGNITGGNIISNNDVTAPTVTATGNVTAGNLLAVNDISGNTGTFAGNVTANYFIGDGSQLTGISAGNVDLSAVSQDIIPAANITYDLGNTTNRWRDIYLANSTIYLGEASIQANATSLIMTNPGGGNFVLSGELTEIEADSGDFSGNVTAAYFIGDGSQLTGISSSGNSITSGNSNIDISSAGADITMSVSGVGNVVVISPDGVVVTGNITGNGIPVTTVSNIAPIDPEQGDVWINTDTGVQLIYFSDGNSAQWAEMEALVSISTVGGTSNLDLSAVAQDIVPAENEIYDLGTSDKRWRDLYLAGNTIDLGGAKIKSDVTEGTIALIPTVITGNTRAVVIGQRGISTVSADDRGEISAEAIAEAASTANTVTGNLISERVLSDNYFFGNGDPFLSAAALKIVRRSQQPLPIRMSSGAKIEIIGRSGNVFVDITV